MWSQMFEPQCKFGEKKNPFHLSAFDLYYSSVEFRSDWSEGTD